MDILIESKKIKAQANKILKESGILDMVADYGDVKIAGSYTLDVMLRPDIDLYVVGPKHDWDKAISIHRKILDSKYFREVYFMDWVKFENRQVGEVEEWIPNLKGYYLAVVIPLEDQRWKMDIWLTTEEYDKSKELTDKFKQLLENTDESKKIAILEIKKSMRKGKTYEKGVDGKVIYKAVLEGGVSNVEEFKKYLEINNN